MFVDVGMGIAVGAGALLIGGKKLKLLFFFVRINIAIGGGLLILGGKKCLKKKFFIIRERNMFIFVFRLALLIKIPICFF